MKNRINKTVICLPAYLLSGLTVVIVLYLTLPPDPLHGTTPRLFDGADKVAHALMMAGVYACMAIDHERRNRQWFRLSVPAYWIIFALTVALGGGIELAQGAMDMGRGCDIMDFVADVIGAVVAMITVALLPWPRQRKP